MKELLFGILLGMLLIVVITTIPELIIPKKENAQVSVTAKQKPMKLLKK